MPDQIGLDIDANLREIGLLIRSEDDSKDRSFLMFVFNLTAIQAMIAKSFEDMKNEHTATLKKHEEKISEHQILVIQGRASWRVGTYVFGGISAVLSAIAVYGFIFVFNMNTVQIQQAVVLPRLESVINEVRLQRQAGIESRADITQQGEDITQQGADNRVQDAKLSSLGKDMTAVHKKKAFIASKSVR